MVSHHYAEAPIRTALTALTAPKIPTWTSSRFVDTQQPCTTSPNLPGVHADLPTSGLANPVQRPPLTSSKAPVT